MSGRAVFDLDGTLLDSVPLCAEILNAMLADRGAEALVTHEQTRRYASGGGEAMVTALLGDRLGDADRAIGEFRARYAAQPTAPSSLFAGVLEGLARLRSQGVALAICSNKPQGLCEKVLSDLGMAELFSTVVGARPGLAPKPDPAGLFLALEMAGGTASRSCYIGDSELDHLAAQRAGVPFIMVGYGYADPGQTFAGAHLAERFADAVATAEELLARGSASRLPSLTSVA
jgi:phosphoglycolate phosphatase